MSDGSNAPKAAEFYITRKLDKRMGIWEAKNEEMHPEYKERNPSPDLNETQYFGFSVPEAKIHALMYTWAHPNLDLVSTGVMVAQGYRPIPPQIDIMDYRAYTPMEAIGRSYMNYTTPGNYSVEVIEPGVKFRTTYLDKERNNSFDVIHTAIHEPQVWSSNVHLEQPLRTIGEVTIRGKRYDVDGTHVRDRSWGEERTETPRNIPPITWMTGVFDNGFCFHATAHDTPSSNPIWKDNFQLAEEDALRFGWVIVDGKQAAVMRVRKLTGYDAHIIPTGVELELTDEHGRTFRMKGETQVAFVFNAWHNCRWPICGTSWTLEDGTKGWGDVQDGQWTDFLLGIS
jgi:hypothetical protein